MGREIEKVNATFRGKNGDFDCNKYFNTEIYTLFKTNRSEA